MTLNNAPCAALFLVNKEIEGEYREVFDVKYPSADLIVRNLDYGTTVDTTIPVREAVILDMVKEVTVKIEDISWTVLITLEKDFSDNMEALRTIRFFYRAASSTLTHTQLESPRFPWNPFSIVNLNIPVAILDLPLVQEALGCVVEYNESSETAHAESNWEKIHVIRWLKLCTYSIRGGPRRLKWSQDERLEDWMVSHYPQEVLERFTSEDQSYLAEMPLILQDWKNQ